ncbi:GlsB/YeaQ/YmgE family stress response membrane protein [Erysipelothrix anatis]|uniref:GlsB/YeaQ/YmgE family stress response membrane protein n=1 Tax=Erysipelothrix anatis TaxID=2683713 RepID=UPI00135B7B8F|nr:GlsB/YeaQ/YmgE family stress response membrane protein [Erysipelothrix anatis]
MLIEMLLIGGVIGLLLGLFTRKMKIKSVVWNVIAGAVGGVVGLCLTGIWGPMIQGVPIFPPILGSIIFIAIIYLLLEEDIRF